MAWTRRQVVAAAGVLGAAPLRRAPLAAPGATVRTIAAMTHVALPPPPLAMAIVRAALPGGVEAPAATAGGVRMIAPEDGAVVARASTRASVGPDARRPLTLPGDIPVAPGSSLALAAADLAALRNPGSSPVQVLDAAIFPAEVRPPPAALTTPAGVQVRLLAYGVLVALPPARFDVTLLDVEADPGGDLPPSLAVGPMVAWVAAGTLVVVAAGPGVSTSSPLDQAGLVRVWRGRPAASGVAVSVTGGGALFLRTAASARIAAGGLGPARLLILRLGESEIS